MPDKILYVRQHNKVIPKYLEWRKWTTLEKATYLAQMAALLTLCLASLFSWLAWREARLARADQAAMFLAEKAPNVFVSAVGVRAGILELTIENSGESSAKNVQFEIRVDGENGRDRLLPLLIPIDPATTTVGFRIPKAGKLHTPAVNLAAAEDQIGFIPTAVRVRHDSLAPEPGAEKSRRAVLELRLLFQDVQLNKYRANQSLEVSR